MNLFAPLLLIGMGIAALGSAPIQAQDSADKTFDIDISLRATPQGVARKPYEDAIKEFAYAVCEQTNGSHSIRDVQVYPALGAGDNADVIWETTCVNTPSYAYVYFADKKIRMCEQWQGISFIADAKASGYTLAHEWGHAKYRLYDEYSQGPDNALTRLLYRRVSPWRPLSTDTRSYPSVMNNQLCAVSSSFGSGIWTCRPSNYTNPEPDFLEFSTERVVPFTGSGANAQLRMYGQSGWDTLIADPKQDPKSNPLGPRTRYTSLTVTGVVPPVNGDYAVNNGSVCRTSPNITWIEGIALDILLDRSGSMSGSLIANAKSGAMRLIDIQTPGESAVGVSSFSNSTSNDFSITAIPKPDTTVKAAAKAAVSGISAGGLTALFDGLELSLQKVTSFSASTDVRKVVFILSDGGDNSSTRTEGEITAAYKSAKVPIMAFGYGSGAPTSVLNSLASSTGGEFFHSPTTRSQIEAVFLAAFAATSNQVVLANRAIPVAASSSGRSAITVDDTLEEVMILATYVGAIGDVAIALVDSSGSDTGVTFSCDAAGGSVGCSATLDSAWIATNGAGDYAVQATNQLGTDVDVAVISTASPGTDGTYDLDVSISYGEDVEYPAPVLIQATVSRGSTVAGLVVSADVFDATGARLETVDLLDDGADSDMVADDGTYTGVFHYTASGTISVVASADNSAGTGQTTFQGALMARLPDGMTPQDPASFGTPIASNFSRSATANVIVSGVQPDDHLDDPTQSCTAINDDNGDIPGRMDRPGDVDCFSFTPTDVNSDLFVRSTAQVGGMDSVVTVLASDGSTVIATADASTSVNPDVGVIARISASDLDTAGMVATIAHSDSAMDQGSYAMSAGTMLTTDELRLPAPAKPTGARATGGNASVMLAWADPSDTTITKWQYRHKAGNGAYGSWTDVPGSDAGTTSYTVSGLTNGTTAYTFQIRAVNTAGGGDASDEVSATPMAPPPPPQRKKSGGGAIDLWTVGIGVLFGLAGLFGRRRRS